ncbi:MAG: GatB/YqeY domain-containing protein [Anaerolineales bacterium]|jgi:uncharacterized protein YqeY
MSLLEKLNQDLKVAIKAKDETRKRVLRLALSAVKLVEVEKQEELDDDAVIAVLQKEAKSRQETIDDAEKAERPDLIEIANAEMDILEEYLPEAMSSEELETLVKEVIAEVGASSMADMGKVMGAIMPKVQGRADGGQVNQMVRQILQG